MKNQLLKLAFEVEIEEGEQLNLPSSIVQGIGKGKWVITIQPKTLVSDRLHSWIVMPQKTKVYMTIIKGGANLSARFQLISSVIPIAFQAFSQNRVEERLQNPEVGRHLFFSEREGRSESHIGSLWY